MYYDALTLAAVADELTDHLVGGRVQKIVQPSSLSLGLEIYAGRRHPLLLSAEAERPGVFLLEVKQRRGTEAPSPLGLLLQKYVRDSRLTAVQQPILERVLRLTFSGEDGPVDLICEIMGRYSNIILVGPDHVILDSIKRVPPSMNRYRTTLPKHPYVAPPPQDKENPLALSLTSLCLALAKQAEGDLARQLVQAVSGISPILAREMVYRASGEVELSGAFEPAIYEKLLKTMDELLRLPQTHAWSPSVAYEEDEEGRWPVAYAPYELTHYPDHEGVEGISAAIRRVLQAARPLDAYKQVRLRLHSLIEGQLGRQRARLASLQRSLLGATKAEDLRRRAQTILALAWTIRPGQRELVVDPTPLGEPVADSAQEPLRIPLDPTLSPSENAQRLFKAYRKMQAAGEEVPALIAQTELEIAYLQQLSTEVDLAENRPQLDEVERELYEAGYLPANAKRTRMLGKGGGAVAAAFSIRSQEGYLILMGRNSQQNDDLTFHRSGPDDLWLHAHGVPGSHVIIRCGGGAVAEETLHLAARLAAYYSAARHEGRVQVDWTARRHVHRLKGGRAGMVTYGHEQTVVVEPALDDLPEEF